MAQSWVPVRTGSDFPIQNLPYGVFARSREQPRVGVAIGDRVLDLAAALGDPEFSRPSLNAFLAGGPPRWSAVRERITRLLTDPAHRAAVEPNLIPLRAVRLHLPFEVRDYVDFYAFEHHAANVGRILRPGSDPLTPNWRHMPLGYHGRSGTVVVSGTPIIRPRGQVRPPGTDKPVYAPSERLDVEAEVGFVAGVPSEMGRPLTAAEFADHVFGVVLLNDWSARDIQAWEYVPLGPFQGKSFATSISPWVVPLAALRDARVSPPRQEPPPLPYLHDPDPWALDIALEASWNGEVVSRPPFRQMYWTPGQLLAHLTANGASLRTGDLFASGTVSGPERHQRGSLLELTWNGAEPLVLRDGSTRRFLQDGDTVTIRGGARGADGVRIGLGEVTGTIRPAT
jgi:fumarylacetoacetase